MSAAPNTRAESDIDQGVSPEGSPDVSIVVVTFHTDEVMLATACASAVASARAAGLVPELIVVDNASPTPPTFSTADCELRLIQRESNDGFAVAVNEGVRAARGALVYCVNPDTETSEPALGALAEVARTHSRALLMGWLSRSGAAQVDASLMWWSSTERLLHRRRHRDALAAAARTGTPLPVRKVSGGALFAPREHLLELGPFDEEFFLYGEDADLSVRARSAGFELLAVPAALVDHQGATSQEHHGALVERARVDAALRLVQHHRGTLARVLVTLELYLITRLGLLAAARTSSHDPHVRRARLTELRRWCTLTTPSKFSPQSGGEPAASSDPSPRPRLLVLAPWMEGGGAQRSLAEVLPTLQGEFHVTIATLFAGCRGHEQLLAAADASVELGLPRSPRGVLRAARSLPALLAGHDVVFSLMRGAHLVYGLASLRGLPAHRLVAAQHQHPAADSAGSQARVEDVFVRRTFRAAESVITPVPFAARWLAEHSFAPRERIWVVPNAFTPDPRPLVAPREGVLDELRLGFTGRLEEEKGLDLLLGFLGELELPRCHLRLAGSGSRRSELEDLAAPARERGHTIEFLGHLKDTVELYDWCDVLVVPSRVELFCYSISEAWGRGRGAITSDIEALAARQGTGPITTLPLEAEVWAEVLQRWAREPQLRAAAFTEGPEAVRAGSHSPRTYTQLMQGARPAEGALGAAEASPSQSETESVQ